MEKILCSNPEEMKAKLDNQILLRQDAKQHKQPNNIVNLGLPMVTSSGTLSLGKQNIQFNISPLSEATGEN